MKFKRMKTLRGILHDTKCEVSLDDLGLFNQWDFWMQWSRAFSPMCEVVLIPMMCHWEEKIKIKSRWYKIPCGTKYNIQCSRLVFERVPCEANQGHFTHEIDCPWPIHFKHSHWWKRRSRSKFTSHYAWGTNKVSERKIDIKSTWNPTWHQMDHATRSLGLFSKTTSLR
jgi:hypothetical protein